MKSKILIPKLHVVIAHAGLASRRKAEELIQRGKVTIDGKIEKNVAARVDPQKHEIKVEGKSIGKIQEEKLYIILHKPKGVVSTVSDPDQKKTVVKLVKERARIYPVGRLDEESEGLILLTNDGDLAYKLTHPKFEVMKEYQVLVQGSPTNTQLNSLRDGVKLREGRTKQAEVGIVKHETGNTWISIGIHEGRNRQVRRMCGAVGLQILKLLRVRFGTLELGTLKSGQSRKLDSKEIDALIQSI